VTKAVTLRSVSDNHVHLICRDVRANLALEIDAGRPRLRESAIRRGVACRRPNQTSYRQHGRRRRQLV
jgi:hypothetical protein